MLYIVGKIIANGGKYGASAGAFMKSALKDARHFFRNWRMQGGELVAANRGGLQLIGRDRDRGASSKILAGLFARWHVWLEACKELWEELKKPRPRMDQLIKILSQYSFPGLGSGWAETGGASVGPGAVTAPTSPSCISPFPPPPLRAAVAVAATQVILQHRAAPGPCDGAGQAAARGPRCVGSSLHDERRRPQEHREVALDHARRGRGCKSGRRKGHRHP